MNWILERLKEPSTKAGLISIAALAGFSLTQGQMDAVWGVIITLVNLYQVFRTEKK
jgi:hypothetical protein